MKVTLMKEWYTQKMCIDNPDCLFIFGDNMIGKGMGGQAIIRQAPNAFGIPTKRLPSRYASAYMSDKQDEYAAINSRLELLKEVLANEYDEIVFPLDGLGTGLAEMPTRSPRLFHFLNTELFKEYGVYG